MNDPFAGSNREVSGISEAHLCVRSWQRTSRRTAEGRHDSVNAAADGTSWGGVIPPPPMQPSFGLLTAAMRVFH